MRLANSCAWRKKASYSLGLLIVGVGLVTILIYIYSIAQKTAPRIGDISMAAR